MRALSLLDLLIISAVVALLVFAGTRDFGRYTGRTLSAVPVAPAATGDQ
jgi:hypothetical protein